MALVTMLSSPFATTQTDSAGSLPARCYLLGRPRARCAPVIGSPYACWPTFSARAGPSSRVAVGELAVWAPTKADGRCPPARRAAIQTPCRKPRTRRHATIVKMRAAATAATSRAVRPRAIGGPLAPASQAPSRSLVVYRVPRSGRSGAPIGRIPKLIVRVRFPSPAPIRNPRTSKD